MTKVDLVPDLGLLRLVEDGEGCRSLVYRFDREVDTSSDLTLGVPGQKTPEVVDEVTSLSD